MSKSAPHPASKVFLTDSPAEIHSKFKSAVTDSTQGVTWDPVERPGIATLLQIYAGYSGEDVEAVAGRYAGARGIMELKEGVAEVVTESLRSFRDEFARIRTEDGYLREKELEGASRAREAAQKTMKEVRVAVGIE
jgi:tryptophanyl-tRNA synthetase